MIVCICGRHKDIILRVADELTLRGDVVLTPYLSDRSGLSGLQERALNDLQLKKIMMADKVAIIIPESILDERTKYEMDYAVDNEKLIEHYVR